MKPTRKPLVITAASVLTVLALASCGSGGDAPDVGEINNAPSSASTESPAPTTSAPPEATESATEPVSSPTRVPLTSRGNDLASAVSDAMNGSLGPAGRKVLVDRLAQDGLSVSLDPSVDRLYERTTHSRLHVVTTTGEATVSTKGSTVTVTVPVVEGTALYEPGENEQDGGDRAAERLRTYLDQKPEPSGVKHKTFTFRITTKNNKGTMSFEEK